jgi:hypothetical protein
MLLELMILLDRPLLLDTAGLRQRLERQAPTLAGGQIEDHGSWLEWQLSPLRLLLRSERRPSAARAMLAEAIDPGPYPASEKARGHSHQAWLRLELLERPADWLQTMATLLAVAGAFADDGASLLLNPAGLASLPVAALCPGTPDERMQLLHAYPLGLVYSGFRKYQLEQQSGLWMCSVDARRYGLSELAMHVPDHGYGNSVLELQDALHRHALRTGTRFQVGESASVLGQTLRFAEPDPDLPFVDQPSHWLELLPT